jgi:chemotaxis protein MotA
MDILTLLGIVVALASILVGQMLEGGHVGSILQLTAFMIVIGGTLGAMFVQNPMNIAIKGFGMLSMAFLDRKQNLKERITQIIELANLSRKSGLLALEGKIMEIEGSPTDRGWNRTEDHPGYP